MKKIFCLLATCATLLLVSCSKEKSIDTSDPDAPGQPGSDNGKGLLAKTVMKYGNDSITIAYAYDDQQRLVREVLSGTEMDFINLDLQIKRNGSGQISKMIIKSDEFLTIGLDSAVYNVFYNAGTNQYTHKILAFEVPGGTYKDSTRFIYDAQNRIIKEEVFVYDMLTDTYYPAAREEYIYAAGNLTQVQSYYFDEMLNDFTLSTEITYEYDAKVNPLALGNDAIVLDLAHNYSPHNIIKQTSIFPDEPSDNSTATATYTYNSSDKPLLSNITETVSGATYTQTYYYR